MSYKYECNKCNKRLSKESKSGLCQDCLTEFNNSEKIRV